MDPSSESTLNSTNFLYSMCGAGHHSVLLSPLSQLLNSRNGSKFKTICWPQTEQLRNQFNPHLIQTQTFTLVSLTKFMLQKCQTRFWNQTDNKQKSELPNRMVSFGSIVRFSVLISMLRTVDKRDCRFAFSWNNKSNSFYIENFHVDFLKFSIQTVFVCFNNSVNLYFYRGVTTKLQ